jgi:beta-galactosidase
MTGLTHAVRMSGQSLCRLVPGLVSVCMIWALADAGNVPLQVRKKLNADYHWHFYQGNPSGDPRQAAYNDSGAGWTRVSVPHSASYDAPWEESSSGDVGFYKGTSWYRKTLPAIPPGGKKFLEYEGAMQVAKVWVNGTQVGYHDISGYTGFCFDITNPLVSTGINAVACSLSNIKSVDIPPGGATNYIDYELYSGLYRDVWFIYTGDVYIPYCGQLIDPYQVSAANGKFKIRTRVTNARSQQVQCILTSYVKDSTGADICSISDTLTIPAGQTMLSTRITQAISSPKLWTPEQPYLYQIYTQVKVAGTTTDDYLQTHGLLFFAFTVNNGFVLNGSRYQLKGVCYHQTIGWIQNALPRSRYFEEVKLIKAGGFNGIRCSHYPRDPDFYEACDKLGVFLLVEVPTWGGTSYSTAYWNRLYQSAKEMVLQGYNHPSIISWGSFNEPLADLSAQIRAERDTIRTIDTARKVYVGRQPQNTPDAVCNAVDVVGLNYTTSRNNANWICVVTEYDDLQGHLRGGTTGLDTTTEISNANYKWNYWNTIVSAGNWLAGGLTWVFNDYSGQGARRTHGIVDMMRVPKRAYYTYRQNFTGVANDNPIIGTATRIDLTADVTTLDADGSDVSLLTATERNAGGACINDVKNVQFTFTGPATLFGAATKSTVEGKINALIKSTSTAGQIRVIAQISGLTPDTVFLNSRAVIDSLDPSIPFVNIIQRPAAVRNQLPIAPVLRKNAHGLVIDFGRSPVAKATLTTIAGRVVATGNISEKSARLPIGFVSKGVYILILTDGLGNMVTKPLVVK